MAAFGIGPDTRTETVPLLQVIQDLPLTILPAAESASGESYWREERIQRGEGHSQVVLKAESLGKGKGAGGEYDVPALAIKPRTEHLLTGNGAGSVGKVPEGKG